MMVMKRLVANMMYERNHSNHRRLIINKSPSKTFIKSKTLIRLSHIHTTLSSTLSGTLEQLTALTQLFPDPSIHAIELFFENFGQYTFCKKTLFLTRSDSLVKPESYCTIFNVGCS